MFSKLLLLFIVMPIVEIALLINLGAVIGGWNTIAIVVITAFIGATLVKREGLATLNQAQAKMRAGQAPEQELMQGLLLLVAGVLLVTPGFVTDAFGLLLTAPFTRPFIAAKLLEKIQTQVVYRQQQQFYSQGFGQQHFHEHTDVEYQTRNDFQQAPRNPAQGGVIEGEYQQKDDDK